MGDAKDRAGHATSAQPCPPPVPTLNSWSISSSRLAFSLLSTSPSEAAGSAQSIKQTCPVSFSSPTSGSAGTFHWQVPVSPAAIRQ